MDVTDKPEIIVPVFERSLDVDEEMGDQLTRDSDRVVKSLCVCVDGTPSDRDGQTSTQKTQKNGQVGGCSTEVPLT